MNHDDTPFPDEIEPDDESSDYFNIENVEFEDLISKLDLDESQNFLPKIIQDELDDYVAKKQLSHAAAEVLTDMITEHMSCFLILGYDYEGNAITIQNSNTQKDVDSLNTLIHKYIFTHATNMGKS